LGGGKASMRLSGGLRPQSAPCTASDLTFRESSMAKLMVGVEVAADSNRKEITTAAESKKGKE
jgi:hypothetical protein